MTVSSSSSSRTRYSGAAQALHWVTAVLVLVAFIYGPGGSESHVYWGAKIATLHGWLGDVILWTAGLHAAAALFHHFVLRDGVLRAMLPGRLGSPS